MPGTNNQSTVYNSVYTELLNYYSPEQSQTLANLAVAQAQMESTNFTSTVFKDNNNAFGYNFVGQSGATAGSPQPGGGIYAKYASVGDSGKEIGRYLGKRTADFNNVSTVDDYAKALSKNDYFEGETWQDYANSMNYYYQKNQTLSPSGNYASGLTVSNAPTTTFAPGLSADNSETLKNNLRELTALNANIDNIEADNVLASWGSRASALEVSDWIGLKQFILYLATRYYPQSLVPFVELIPKFFLDDAKAVTKNNDTKDFAFGENVNDIQRFGKTKDKMTSLNQNGGIDLLTLDPFQDYSTAYLFDNDNNKKLKDTKSGGRGFGYRIFGTLVLTPGINNDETSKAGGVGFKSLEIQNGLSIQQGISLVTIKLLDVQGNKFLDIASPWSFLLNSPKTTGDFYFRYGWQIRIPEDNSAVGSTGYKYWNHPGWKLFGTAKNDIIGLAKGSDWTISLTQSKTAGSFWAPGYSTVVTNGLAVFPINRVLTPDNYVVMSIQSPELSVDSQDGSITASIMLRNNNTFGNCFVPLANADSLHRYANTHQPLFLYDFMSKFCDDNYEFIKNSDNFKQYKAYAIRPNKKVFTRPGQTAPTTTSTLKSGGTITAPNYYETWLTVKKASNPNVYVNPKDIPIFISTPLLGEMNNNYKSQNTDVLLMNWVSRVLAFNNMTISGLGDAPGFYASNGAGFFIIQDDNKPNQTTETDATKTSTTDYIGLQGAARLTLQDDVFAYRFIGSLVEELRVEINQNPNKNTVDAQDALAKNFQSPEVVAAKSVNDLSETSGVTWKEKRLRQFYELSKLRNANIKTIAHPWLVIGTPVFIKGTGTFDGQYIVASLKHELSQDNKFTTEINAVKTALTEDYDALINEPRNNGVYNQENAKAEFSGIVPTSSASQSYYGTRF